MPEHESLGTIAEIFVGLAGFSGIALALKANPGPYYLFRVVLIIVSAFTAIAVALVPVALASAGLAPPTVWRIGSGVLTVVFVVITPIGFVYRRTARPEELRNWAMYSTFGPQVANACAQAANAAGWIGGGSFAVLHLGLVVTLLYCGALFIFLVTVGRLEKDGAAV